MFGSSYHDLVQEVLNKLLLQRPRGQQPVQVCAQEFCDEVAAKTELVCPLAQVVLSSIGCVHVFER